MTKSEAIKNWRDLEEDQPILKHMTAIPYKSTGSKYGTCGIRIDGNPEFVEAVLSHLKELLDGENDDTRLQLSRSVVENTGDHNFCNRESGAEVCYIRLHERGNESRHYHHVVSAITRKRAARHEEEYLD